MILGVRVGRTHESLKIKKAKETRGHENQTNKRKNFCTVVKPKIAIDIHSAFRTSCFRINFKDGRNFHLNRVVRSDEY